jgi:hypothetical protein
MQDHFEGPMYVTDADPEVPAAEPPEEPRHGLDRRQLLTGLVGAAIGGVLGCLVIPRIIESPKKPSAAELEHTPEHLLALAEVVSRDIIFNTKMPYMIGEVHLKPTGNSTADNRSTITNPLFINLDAIDSSGKEHGLEGPRQVYLPDFSKYAFGSVELLDDRRFLVQLFLDADIDSKTPTNEEDSLVFDLARIGPVIRLMPEFAAIDNRQGVFAALDENIWAETGASRLAIGTDTEPILIGYLHHTA